MTTTSEEREIQVFKSDRHLERSLIRALCDEDWEWVQMIFEDARLMHSDTLARLGRKYGCTDHTVAVMLRLRSEEAQPKQEKLF